MWLTRKVQTCWWRPPCCDSGGSKAGWPLWSLDTSSGSGRVVLVALGVSRSSSSDLWLVTEQGLVVLLITHPQGPAAAPGDPRLVPNPRRGSGHPDWTPCRVQGHLGHCGSLGGSRSRARSSPGPILSPGCDWPRVPGPRPGPAHLLCQAVLCQRPESHWPQRGLIWPCSAGRKLPGSCFPRGHRAMATQQCPHGLLSPLVNIPFQPVNITIYLSFIY